MKIVTLGDTHLGKVFQNGVPLHRRGDRERMQWAQFEAHLNAVDGVDFHIQVGDLFDKFQVSNNIVFRTAMAYRAAAGTNPDCFYIVNRGNHDASKDLERVSSYQMFAAMCAGIDNLVVLQDEPRRFGSGAKQQCIAVIPWHPTLTALELVEKYADDLKWNYGGVAYGHWDLVAIGDTTNLIPAGRLLELGFKSAVTGHDHLAREMVVLGLPVTVTGSMQPYSHAEDPDELIYVTRTLTQALAGDWADKCLRITLDPTEVLDTPIECLSLQLARGKDDGAEAAQVDFEEFDFDALLTQAVEEIGMTAPMAAIVAERLEAARAAQQ